MACQDLAIFHFPEMRLEFDPVQSPAVMELTAINPLGNGQNLWVGGLGIPVGSFSKIVHTQISPPPPLETCATLQKNHVVLKLGRLKVHILKCTRGH